MADSKCSRIYMYLSDYYLDFDFRTQLFLAFSRLVFLNLQRFAQLCVLFNFFRKFVFLLLLIHKLLSTFIVELDIYNEYCELNSIYEVFKHSCDLKKLHIPATDETAPAS